MLAFNKPPEHAGFTAAFVIVLKLVKILLLCIITFIAWLIKFVLYTILYTVCIAEAVIVALLQLLAVIKEIIKVLFSLGTLLYHIGYNIGVFGTLFLVLGLCTYVFQFKPSFLPLQLSTTKTDFVWKVLLAIWVGVAPIVLIFGYIKLKTTVRKIVKRITAQEVDTDDYTECICGKMRIRYFEKSTETIEDHSVEGDHGAESSSKEMGRTEEAASDNNGDNNGDDSSDKEVRRSGRGLGRGRGQGRGRGLRK